MASLIRYVNVPGNYEELTFPVLLKEIVIDDVVVSATKPTFLEVEVNDIQVALDYLDSYKEYVSLIIDKISNLDAPSKVSYNDLALIKLATIACIDMIDFSSTSELE